MLKKCLSAFLSFAIITTAGVGNLPADIFGNTVHAATTGTVINKYGINFRVESNQTLTVTGRDTNRTSVIIPTYIDGMKVAQVSAFSSSSSMPSVLEIPDPITNYGRLYASKLTVPSFSTSTSAKPLEITNTESISSNATLNRTVNDPSSLILNKKVKKFIMIII